MTQNYIMLLVNFNRSYCMEFSFEAISEKTSINSASVIAVFESLAISIAGVVACFSKNEDIKISGMTVVTAVAYGILNDMIACRDSIEYFIIGHFWDGHNVANRLIMNLDPNINAIFWGITATAALGFVAGAIFTVLARFTTNPEEETSNRRLDTRVTAKKIFPYLSIFSVITFIAAHTFARIAQHRMAESPYEKYGKVPLNMQAGWEACNVRNTIGYAGLALGTLLISTGIIATRIFGSYFKRPRSYKEN